MTSALPAARSTETSPVDRIQHRPEQVALKLECADSRLLQFAGVAIMQSTFQGFSRIAWRLSQSAFEVFQATCFHPGIKALEGGKSFGHQVGSEEFRQRGSNGNRPELGARKGDIGIDGETDAWQHALMLQQFPARKAAGFP